MKPYCWPLSLFQFCRGTKFKRVAWGCTVNKWYSWDLNQVHVIPGPIYHSPTILFKSLGVLTSFHFKFHFLGNSLINLWKGHHNADKKFFEIFNIHGEIRTSSVVLSVCKHHLKASSFAKHTIKNRKKTNKQTKKLQSLGKFPWHHWDQSLAGCLPCLPLWQVVQPSHTRVAKSKTGFGFGEK